ncbi:MAG: helix-turn-helix transcriptional regulator [Actinomycetota bacterium]
MKHRHLEVAEGTPVEELGLAAIDDILDRGDLTDWAPLARAIAAEPHGKLANSVLRLCDAHPLYGTSVLWRSWIEGLRSLQPPEPSAAIGLSALRLARGMTQTQLAARMGISQSDVSKLERRSDMRVSTLAAAVESMEGTLRLSAEFSDGTSAELALGPEQTSGVPAKPGGPSLKDAWSAQTNR